MTTAHIKIEQEVLKWTPADRVSLAERLLESVDDFATPEMDRAWRAETSQRLAEIESGQVSGLTSDAVFSEARRKLNEARQLSSSRTK